MTGGKTRAKGVAVHWLRRLILSNRVLASAMLGLALLMKLALPAGLMTTMSQGTIVVSLCSGTGPMKIAMAIPGLEHGKPDDQGHKGQAEQPCAFAGLSAPSLAAADPVLLAIAILFLMALGMRPLATILAAIAPPYLRPPLRGPPAAI